MLLVLILLSFAACGSNSSKQETKASVSETQAITTEDSVKETMELETQAPTEAPVATSEEAAAVQYAELGETVSTDIVDFTIESAAFTIACSNATGDDYLSPKEYDAATDSKNPFVAPIGKTLVALTFTIKNNNRTTLKVADSSAWSLNWKVSYNGQEYALNGQEDDNMLQFRTLGSALCIIFIS